MVLGRRIVLDVLAEPFESKAVALARNGVMEIVSVTRLDALFSVNGNVAERMRTERACRVFVWSLEE